MRQARGTAVNTLWFGLLLGLVAGAITIWPIRYSDLNMGSPVMLSGWVLLCAAAGGYLAGVTDRTLAQIALLVSGGVVGAVVLRVIVECAQDPTDHNLWPFEVVWAMLVCYPSTFAGAWIGRRFLRG